jgi:hypothetical protein
MNPAVTVVIPTRNRRQRVAGAVASAQRQTLRDIEILVVDDASTDGTGEVLADVASQDPRVRVLRQEEPGGAPRARNRGLDDARGEFVAFLDDDDRWLPSKLERQVSFLADHPQVVLVGCHYRTVVEGADQALDFRGPSELTGDDLLWWNFLGSASNAVVVPRRLPEAVRFDPEFPAYQDWDFYLQCSEFGPVGVVPEVLCEYVVHDEPGRITNQLANRLVGHELTLRRHGKRMSPACLAYHRARMRVLGTTSKAEKLRLVPSLLHETPAVVLRALVTESVSSRVGRLRHDPALPQRQLQKLAAATRRGSQAGSFRHT